MRTYHLLAASAVALLNAASWAQTGPVLDPTGALWINEQIAAARRVASEEAASAAARRPGSPRVASKQDAPKTAEFSRPGHVTQPSTATITPSPEGAR